MARKIKAQNEWPFFQAYHDSAYISRHDCSKEVVLRESGEYRLYKLHNTSGKELVIYNIDGGLVSDDDVLKCDYGIFTENNLLFLVELKGKDLNHALDQINSTIDILIKRPGIKVMRLNARIVLSKVSVPKITVSKEKKLMQLLYKSCGGGDYTKRSRVLEETL